MGSGKMKRVYQIGIIVKDAKKSMEQFCNLFDLDFSKARIVDTTNVLTEAKYGGKDVEYAVIIAMMNYAGVEFEFISPLTGGDDNPYSDFLKEHGPGIHHIHVQFADYEKTSQALQEAGAKIMTSGKLGSWGLFEYYDLRESLGLIIESSPILSDAYIQNAVTENLVE